MALNKTEQRAIANLITRLKKPDCGCSYPPWSFTDKRAKLNDAGIECVSRIYVDTWIISALQNLLDGDAKLAEELSRP